MEEMQFQGQTGKIYNAGTDRWGRPVVIFNNSVNNSNDPRAQMRYLAFNLETALRKARVRLLRECVPACLPACVFFCFLFFVCFLFFLFCCFYYDD
jgi:hypothetical protein